MSKILFLFVSTVVLLVTLRIIFFFSFPLKIADGETVHFTATIFDDPKILGKTQVIKLRYGNFWQSVPVTVMTTKNTTLRYGDGVEITGTLKKVLLKDKTSVFVLYFPKIEAKKKGIVPVFAKIRQDITNFCEKTFSQPYSGLLSGMLLGVKNTLPDPVTISFRITGVSHVVAASGMNVTLIAGFLMSFLGRLFKRQWAVILSMLGIGGYMVLSGLDPSILRAGVMGLLVFGAQLFGRQYTVMYSLFLTTGLLLFWDPLLLGDIGFQLSVLATLGIIFLKPLVPLKGFFLDDIGTTIAAQAATLPILLSTFGSYGILSLLVNALVLWTIPLVTIVGGIGVTLGLFSQPVGQAVLWIIFPLLWYFENVVAYFADFHAVWEIGTFPVFLGIGYYLLLLSWVMVFSLSKGQIKKLT